MLAAILCATLTSTIAANEVPCATKHTPCKQEGMATAGCCLDADFVCTVKNKYVSLCEPKPKMRVQDDADDDGQYPIKECSTNYSQCRGQSGTFGGCCQDPHFECRFKSDWTWTCEPKASPSSIDDQGQLYAQCGGGKDYTGNTSCSGGTTCVKLNNDYWQCRQTLNTWDQCGGEDYQGSSQCPDGDVCVERSRTFSQCTPRARAPYKALKEAEPLQCGTKWSQCNGQHWSKGVCCQDPTFQCNYKGRYLSVCEPKPKTTKDVEAVDVWQQCGGKDWGGATSCSTGNVCAVVDASYWQCKPVPSAPGVPTYSECDASSTTVASCRKEDVCTHLDGSYWQCLPRAHVRHAQDTQVNEVGN
ncbi:Aste57867_24992 [Aphanomyces stellatus]|uniref:Aste57867_24992 protein n=1 Tax=Aphanomyces stellatus TaxID=120398 RepID=A0A485LRZ6_9STRA|nr:hypothetical protein As57867_024914 [Aphanomyces stellatus]VFU01623.1 Aste57867_24992 [Aphanomyces stellatus]